MSHPYYPPPGQGQHPYGAGPHPYGGGEPYGPPPGHGQPYGRPGHGQQGQPYGPPPGHGYGPPPGPALGPPQPPQQGSDLFTSPALVYDQPPEVFSVEAKYTIWNPQGQPVAYVREHAVTGGRKAMRVMSLAQGTQNNAERWLCVMRPDGMPYFYFHKSYGFGATPPDGGAQPGPAADRLPAETCAARLGSPRSV